MRIGSDEMILQYSERINNNAENKQSSHIAALDECHLQVLLDLFGFLFQVLWGFLQIIFKFSY